MELTAILRSLAALGVVLALLYGGLWLLRRYGASLSPKPGQSPDRRLQILETLSLPPRHKLVRVQAGSDEHVLLLGPQGDLLLSSDTAAQPVVSAEQALDNKSWSETP